MLLSKLFVFQDWPRFVLEGERAEHARQMKESETVTGRKLAWYTAVVMGYFGDLKDMEEPWEINPSTGRRWAGRRWE
jgi:hypothetical protein